MRLPRFRRPAEARPPDQRVENLASRVRNAAWRARESGPGRRCERWLGGVWSGESASRILRSVFSAAPVVFALHIKLLVAKSKAYLSDAEPEIRAALSQPLSASKSLFDATLVFLLWNPVMEIRSLEHLKDVVLGLIR